MTLVPLTAVEVRLRLDGVWMDSVGVGKDLRLGLDTGVLVA